MQRNLYFYVPLYGLPLGYVQKTWEAGKLQFAEWRQEKDREELTEEIGERDESWSVEERGYGHRSQNKKEIQTLLPQGIVTLTDDS